MELDAICSEVETLFNIGGSIPVVAVFTSLLRIEAAKVQLVASAAIALISLFGQMIESNVEKWERVTDKAVEHIVHGALNVIRGFGEVLLGTTIVGSLGLFAYQSFSENKFEPIYKYNEI